MCVIHEFATGSSGFVKGELRKGHARHLNAGEVAAIAAKMEWWERAYLEAATGETGHHDTLQAVKRFKAWLYLQATSAGSAAGWSVENDDMVKRLVDLAAFAVVGGGMSKRTAAAMLGLSWGTYSRKWNSSFEYVFGLARSVESSVRARLEAEFYC
jgi:heptaprenylglyceryl phosphate synthase